MSTTEDKEKAVSAQTTGEVQEKKHAEGSGGNAAGPIILFFIVGFVASMILGWVVFPKVLYSKKEQPFNFNHALHNQEVGDCESCHFFRDDGTFAGVPSLSACIDCHEEVMGETADEAKFVNLYVANNLEVPWLIYSKQPDCVFFSHAAHVKGAEMACETCHGHIGESESMKPYEYNRITGYSKDIWGSNMLGLKTNPWDRMKMDDCAECHVRENVKQSSVQTGKGACFVCHK